MKFQINFMRYRWLAITLSSVALLGSVALFFSRGLDYGIDFAGGLEIHYRFFSEGVGEARIRRALASLKLADETVQRVGSEEDREFLIRTGDVAEGEEIEKSAGVINTALEQAFGTDQFELRKVDAVGPKVGQDLRKKGWAAVFYALVFILIYIFIRFDLHYAVAAVVCLVHDAVLTIGVFSLFGKQFDLAIVAALLTIIGYSLNDTIVVFDRIREKLQRAQGVEYLSVINRGLNETLSRTVLTSLTTLLVVLALFVFGGAIIHDFAFALMFGVIVGTYSTIYIASPIFNMLRQRSLKQ